MDDATLTIRLCERLAIVPGWSWRPGGPAYTDDELGIYYGAIPAEAPWGIGVRVYGGDDVDTVERRAQLRIRGLLDSRPGADRIAGIALTVLHGLSRWGGINDIRRTSFDPKGEDATGRQGRTDNYRIRLDNPEASI